LLYQDAAGGWHILDFKTNVVTRENLADVAANYEMQMLVYAMAAENILKCPPQELSLHFLRTGGDFPFSWNEQARRRIVELVEQSCVSS
jgi:ATP-dependent exoDNAse (exonuclease V) beta subunit